MKSKRLLVPDSRPRVAMLQDGARLHYAVPIALHHAGILEGAFIDWYSPPASPQAWAAALLGWVRPGLGKALAERFSAELESAPISRNTWLALNCALSRSRFPTPEAYFRWYAQKAARWVLAK